MCSSYTSESYTKLELTSQFKNFIAYSPYENIPPFSVQKQTVHYGKEPSFTITNMERVKEEPHWGKETINQVHSGALLKGPFSKFDYHESQKRFSNGLSSVSAFTAVLPASQNLIYYKDVTANVSSHLRILLDTMELHVQLMFTLLGILKRFYTIVYNICYTTVGRIVI